jgi:hypothetical protein
MAEQWFQPIVQNQVDRASRQIGDLAPHSAQRERADFVMGIKTGQRIDIAVRPKVLPQNRAKQGQAANMIRLARTRDLVNRDMDLLPPSNDPALEAAI